MSYSGFTSAFNKSAPTSGTDLMSLVTYGNGLFTRKTPTGSTLTTIIKCGYLHINILFVQFSTTQQGDMAPYTTGVNTVKFPVAFTTLYGVRLNYLDPDLTTADTYTTLALVTQDGVGFTFNAPTGYPNRYAFGKFTWFAWGI